MANGSGVSCPSCRIVATAGQRFCGECGARLARLCGACGAENPAANRFCGQCGLSLVDGDTAATESSRPQIAGTPSAPATSSTPAATHPRDERRWATVLFADVSGYTSMSERMDHEDVKALTQHCAQQLAQEIRRFGGTVLSVQGDGVLAVFGAPLAHEDDAERAIRAAVAIHALSLSGSRPAATDGEPAEQIRVHIGINTGEVMAGLIGPPERRDYTVVGDTVNTASRLMTAARPGTTLVGAETHRATRRLARYRRVPPIDAKGKDQPLAAWEVVDVTAVPAGRPLGTAALVGRDHELALLAGLWTKVVREARPHLITVLGEPGIGKSRLIAELERGTLGGAVILHGRCLPYGETLGYWALATALREAAGSTADDDAETARAALGTLVSSVIDATSSGDDPDEIARHLALLIGLSDAADGAAGATTQRTLHTSARRFFEALARRGPVCLLLEDIHWADDALLDLIEAMASRANDAPLFIVAQARPELLEKRPAWGRGVRAFTSLSLETLSEPDAHALVMALCRERGLPDSTADQIGRGAGGNPLFAEEMVATIAERSGEAPVPSAIKALIAARLDGLLPEHRRILQLAAVFGKVFWQDGLRALDADGSGDALPEWLEALELKDLLRAQPRSQFRGDREYWFKHDLIRDVAYETLPRSERRSLHGRVADWIEQRSGERLEERLDLLAHHAVQADQQERARDYLSLAAGRARRAAAHREEAALLAQAIALAELTGPDDLVASLRARRGRALGDIGMWADARPELEAALAVFAATDRERAAEIQGDLAEISFWMLDTPSLGPNAHQALALAEEVGREDLAARALAWVAEVAKVGGDLATAREHYLDAMERVGGMAVGPLVNAVLALYQLGETQEAVTFGRDSLRLIHDLRDTPTTSHGLPHVGLALASIGHYGEAAAVFEEACQFTREHEGWPFLARATAMSAGFHLDVYDYAGNEALVNEAREIARSAGFLPPVVSGGIDLLLNFTRRGDVGQAEGLVGEVADVVEQTANWHGWLWKIRLAEARAEIALAQGDLAGAVRLADDAIARSRSHGRRKYQILGHWTRARALAGLNRTDDATADLREALVLARRLGDPALLIRVATVLLPLDGGDALAADARAAVEQTIVALPTDELRERFQAAEPVRLLVGLTV